MDSFIMYRSTLDALRSCPPDVVKDALIMMGDYEMDGKIPDQPGMAFAMFLSVRPLIDKRRKKAEAGRLGGLKKAENARGLLVAKPSKPIADPKQNLGKDKRLNIKDKRIKEKEQEEKEVPPYKAIIDHLNQKAGKNFRASGSKTRECIQARWNEGYSLDDFIRVIDNMTAKWKGDAKMDEYLRPETLFSRKFEGYLNTKVIHPKSPNRFNNFKQREYDFDDLERRLLNANALHED